MTKTLVQHAKITTNTEKGSVCSITVEAVGFSELWAAYPDSPPYVDVKTGKPPKGYENQCAIKVSVAIHVAGVEMKSFKGASVSINGKKAAVRAAELATWLKQQPFCGLPKTTATVTGKDWQEKLKGKTGIVFFANYWAREGEASTPSGDHVDLWNGSRLTASGTGGALTSFARFTLGIGSLWYSDLGKATEILFWEIK
jgi:Type VI secretion system (T6SS), amidase effector protein 4